MRLAAPILIDIDEVGLKAKKSNIYERGLRLQDTGPYNLQKFRHTARIYVHRCVLLHFFISQKDYLKRDSKSTSCHIPSIVFIQSIRLSGTKTT